MAMGAGMGDGIHAGSAREGGWIAIVATAVASAADADRLAALMVAQRLAACVQVGQVVSHYRWRDALHREAEWRLECKTAVGRADALLAALAQHHPYELPECLAWTVRVSRPYADWVERETRGPG